MVDRGEGGGWLRHSPIKAMSANSAIPCKATQSHLNATSKPPQSVLIANRLRPQSHPKTTPKPPQDYPKATPKPPWGKCRMQNAECRMAAGDCLWLLSRLGSWWRARGGPVASPKQSACGNLAGHSVSERPGLRVCHACAVGCRFGLKDRVDQVFRIVRPADGGRG